MQLSDLLGRPVRDTDNRRLGTVIDVRLRIPGAAGRHPPPPQLYGLIVSPRTTSSYLGYERSEARGPTLLAALLRWRHRGTFLALWPDVARIDDDAFVLRAEFTPYSALLRTRN